eukprot:SAG22_NODE_5574_length_991_cov_1.311659_1_plen_134_part_00
MDVGSTAVLVLRTFEREQDREASRLEREVAELDLLRLDPVRRGGAANGGPVRVGDRGGRGRHRFFWWFGWVVWCWSGEGFFAARSSPCIAAESLIDLLHQISIDLCSATVDVSAKAEPEVRRQFTTYISVQLY